MHIRIPMIQNLPYPFLYLCYAFCTKWGWNFTISLSNMYWIWNKMSSLSLVLVLSCHPDCFATFYFSASILKYILSLVSSLSAFYFPTSNLSRFLFKVLESFRENSSGRNPKEINVQIKYTQFHGQMWPKQ